MFKKSTFHYLCSFELYTEGTRDVTELLLLKITFTDALAKITSKQQLSENLALTFSNKVGDAYVFLESTFSALFMLLTSNCFKRDAA